MTNKNPFFDLYIDWVNNFLTVERFAQYYGISEELAQMVIDHGRDQYRNVEVSK